MLCPKIFFVYRLIQFGFFLSLILWTFLSAYLFFLYYKKRVSWFDTMNPLGQPLQK